MNNRKSLGLLAGLLGLGGEQPNPLREMERRLAVDYLLRGFHNPTPEDELEKIKLTLAEVAAMDPSKIQALVIGVVVRKDTWEPEMCGNCDNDHAIKSAAVFYGHGPQSFIDALHTVMGENPKDNPNMREVDHDEISSVTRAQNNEAAEDGPTLTTFHDEEVQPTNEK